MTRLILLLALLATPALADEVCSDSAVVGASRYPIVETTALMEALQDVPLAKRPQRVTEATHHALLDATVMGNDSAWTLVPMLDEELENLGVVSPVIAVAMMERRMDEQAAAAQRSIDFISHQMHDARRDYAAVRQALSKLAAEQPPVVAKAGLIPPLASLANLFRGRPARLLPEAQELSSWRRGQLMRRQALQQEQTELLREMTALNAELNAQLQRRDLHDDAAAAAAALGCGLERFIGPDTVQY